MGRSCFFLFCVNAVLQSVRVRNEKRVFFFFPFNFYTSAVLLLDMTRTVGPTIFADVAFCIFLNFVGILRGPKFAPIFLC